MEDFLHPQCHLIRAVVIAHVVAASSSTPAAAVAATLPGAASADAVGGGATKTRFSSNTSSNAKSPRSWRGPAPIRVH